MIKHLSINLLVLLTAFVFFSCGKPKTADNIPDLSSVNNAKIYYKEDFDSTGRQKVKTVLISDAKQINNLTQIINEETSPLLYCGASGAIAFYTDSALVMDMTFNSIPEYRHIAYNLNGKVIGRVLKEENIKFLESLRQ